MGDDRLVIPHFHSGLAVMWRAPRLTQCRPLAILWSRVAAMSRAYRGGDIVACEPGLRRSYKYKIRPTIQQATVLDLTLGLCQRLYNTALDQRRMVWRQRGVNLGYYEQKRELPALKDAEPEFRDAH